MFSTDKIPPVIASLPIYLQLNLESAYALILQPYNVLDHAWKEAHQEPLELLRYRVITADTLGQDKQGLKSLFNHGVTVGD